MYGYAKLRMLEWTHQFMQRYLSRDNYELAEMDTDSSYFALAKPTLDECVRPQLLLPYYRHYDEWFLTLACAKHKNAFVATKATKQECVMDECCKAAHEYDKRTPGKFKIEFQGDGIIALCSKTYICFGSQDDENVKLSCKGLQKKKKLRKFDKTNLFECAQKPKSGPWYQ